MLQDVAGGCIFIGRPPGPMGMLCLHVLVYFSSSRGVGTPGRSPFEYTPTGCSRVQQGAGVVRVRIQGLSVDLWFRSGLPGSTDSLGSLCMLCERQRKEVFQVQTG